MTGITRVLADERKIYKKIPTVLRLDCREIIK